MSDREKYATGYAWLDRVTDPYWRFLGWTAQRSLVRMLAPPGELRLIPAPTERLAWWQRIIGRFVIPTAADPQRPRIALNRYPHEIIGICVYPGGRRYLSWVWPFWIVGVPLTGEQFNRHVRELLRESDGHGETAR